MMTGLTLALSPRPVAAQAPEKPADPGVELTSEERAWIAAHPVIRAGHDTTYAPYAFPGNAGEIVGIDPDFLALVTKRTGLQFHHESRANWSVMMEAFKAHEVDVLGSVGTSPERESYMAITASYTLAPNVIITRTDSPYLFDLRDLAGRTISVPRGYAGLRNDLNERAPGHQLVEYDNSLECYQAVARGQVFASIGDVANAAYLIKANHLSNLRLGSVISASSEIFFGVRKDWPELTSIMNKAIGHITELERKRINDRWIAVDYLQDRWWVTAFRVAVGIAAAACVVFLLVFLHNRRLATELEQRRRIQAELEQTRDRLARISEEKSELLRMVTHDLRSPLTGLMLGTDLLRQTGVDGDTARRTLEQMRVTAQQMMRLTNDLVDVNALEAGQRKFNWTTVDACALFHEVVGGLSESAARKRIPLALLTQEPAMTLQSDLTALRQVAENLISNAVKFSPAGLEIEVDLRWCEVGLRIQVRDHGPGISPEARARIFSQYAQGGARPTGGEKSTGLGLWIVQRIVAGLHGQVWYESPPGQGAVFVVELPRTPPA